MTDDTQAPRCEHTDDMFEAVSPTRLAQVEARALLALDALNFDSGNWEQESIERHMREQIDLAKGHLQSVIQGEPAPDFIGFANKMFGISWAGCHADGGTIQELGEQYGLLKETEMQEPCGEACMCRECGADFPTNCYRKTYNKGGLA